MTGIAFPTHRSFAYAGRKDFSLLGASVRARALVYTHVICKTNGRHSKS